MFLLGGVPAGPAVDLAAACLSTGAVGSHRSAAHLHGLIDQPPSRPELTVGPTHSMRGAPLLHRSSDLLPSDVLRIEGMRTTNAARTLIDVGAVVPRTVLESALERALHEGLTTFDRLVRRFFQLARSGRPGIAPLRTLLVDRDPSLAPAESDLETLAVRLRRNGSAASPRECLRSHRGCRRVSSRRCGRAAQVGRLRHSFDSQYIRDRPRPAERVGNRGLAATAIHLAGSLPQPATRRRPSITRPRSTPSRALVAKLHAHHALLLQEVPRPPCDSKGRTQPRLAISSCSVASNAASRSALMKCPRAAATMTPLMQISTGAIARMTIITTVPAIGARLVRERET